MKTIRMKKSDWEQWDAALRSGEYRQAQEQLCGFVTTQAGDDADKGAVGFCCLGVLQMVLDGAVETNSAPEGCSASVLTEPQFMASESYDVPSMTWLARHGIEFCPLDAREQGLDLTGTKQNPYLPKFGTSAADANDTGRSFAEIADAIKDAVEFTDA